MIDIGIVIYYPYLDGTTTSLIDLYFNLSHYMNVNCYIIIDTSQENVKRNVKYIQTLKNSIPFDKFKFTYIQLSKLNEFCLNHKFNNLILSFGIFRFLNTLPFHYNKLIILDSGRIIYDYYCCNSKFISYVKSLNNVFILGNNMNKHFFNYEQYFLYYHKFSHERFDFLKCILSNDLVVTENVREKTGNIDMKYLQSNKLYYNRWRDVKGDNKIYSENIGKMIFEFSALNKFVHYSPINKTHDDGLTEYLRLFDIDDNYELIIKISENELFDKLGFNDNDLILSIIKRN